MVSLIRLVRVGLVSICLWLGPVSTPRVFGGGDPSELITIYILQQAWHTGIVLKTSTVPDSLWPGVSQFARNRYLDIGWGDEAYYQEPGVNIPLALRAVLIPTQSVIRVRGFWYHPEEVYGTNSSLFKLALNRDQYYRLIRFIANSFTLGPDGNPMLSQRKAGTNDFFLAHGKYHLFNTCNTWVALALRASTFPVRTCFIITRGQLARQLKRIVNG